MNYYGMTDKGQKRENNEDTFFCARLARNAYLFVVCDGMGGVADSLSAMFGVSGLALYNSEAIYYTTSYTVPIALAAILSTPLAKNICTRIASKAAGDIVIAVLKPICYITILIICTASLIDGSFNPFIYFRF